jgi:hypothetical protein
MDGYQRDNGGAASKVSKGREASLWVLGLVVLLVIGFTLEDDFGVPFATTLRVALVGSCQFFIYKLGSDYPGEQWPRIGFWASLVVNIAIFFTPLVDRPAYRGEAMLFALPDAIVVLTARTASYPVTDVHQRAIRQQMILGLIVAIAFCVILFTLTLIDHRTGHSWGWPWRHLRT